jgi:hypothetical protein
MTCRDVDPLAKERAGNFPPSLYIPIAARDEDAIEQYLGSIVTALTSRNGRRALLVRAHPGAELDLRVPVWHLNEAAVLRAPLQVWVDVDLSAYRQAYARAFPDEDLTGRVLDHIMNRRVARLKGFRYVRIVPISRAANSCSGGLSERWGTEYHRTPRMIALNRKNRARVQYADVADLVKMLDRKTGNNLQDGVNDALRLFEVQRDAEESVVHDGHEARE